MSVVMQPLSGNSLILSSQIAVPHAISWRSRVDAARSSRSGLVPFQPTLAASTWDTPERHDLHDLHFVFIQESRWLPALFVLPCQAPMTPQHDLTLRPSLVHTSLSSNPLWSHPFLLLGRVAWTPAHTVPPSLVSPLCQRHGQPTVGQARTGEGWQNVLKKQHEHARETPPRQGAFQDTCY